MRTLSTHGRRRCRCSDGISLSPETLLRQDGGCKVAWPRLSKNGMKVDCLSVFRLRTVFEQGVNKGCESQGWVSRISYLTGRSFVSLEWNDVASDARSRSFVRVPRHEWMPMHTRSSAHYTKKPYDLWDPNQVVKGSRSATNSASATSRTISSHRQLTTATPCPLACDQPMDVPLRELGTVAAVGLRAMEQRPTGFPRADRKHCHDESAGKSQVGRSR